MQDTLVLREAQIRDLPAIAEHWLAMFEANANFREEDFLPDWRRRFIAFFTREITAGEAAYFVAVDGERVVGTAGAMVAGGFPAVIHGIRNGLIFGVHVDHAYRGHGIATRLTESAVTFLQERKPWAIRLHASPFGRPIYEKMGFTPTNEMQLRPAGSSRAPNGN